MGMSSLFTGNSTAVTPEEFGQQFGHLLVDGETVGAAFRTVRDYYAFTEHRLIIINAQGWSGKKKEIATVPLRSISWFSVETGGVGRRRRRGQAVRTRLGAGGHRDQEERRRHVASEGADVLHQQVAGWYAVPRLGPISQAQPSPVGNLDRKAETLRRLAR